MRLNKFLTSINHCSRREADRLISAGRVTIDNKQAELGTQLVERQIVAVDGKPVGSLDDLTTKEYVYLAYHKPVGVICTTSDTQPDNVIQRVNYPERVYPIGRLDVASSGLLLLTNDGSVVNGLLRGEHDVEKEYHVIVHKPIDDRDLERLGKGIPLDGHMTRPAIVQRTGATQFLITITEGRNRQIRRMLEHLGYDVRRLQRRRIGHITLGDLAEDTWRLLTPHEARRLHHSSV